MKNPDFYISEPITPRQMWNRYKGKKRHYNLTFSFNEFVRFCRDNDIKKQDSLYVNNPFLDEVSLADIEIYRAGRMRL